MTQIQNILLQKQLSSDLFDRDHGLSLELPLEDHTAWLYEHIYSKPYKDSASSAGVGSIARLIHGIQHVSRVAYYVSVFANLFRRYGDKEALSLTSEDIKLLQIAALFHDSAREDENEDHWDDESALFFYHYATKVLHVEPAKAMLIAEAIANKDATASKYLELNEAKGCFSLAAKPPPTKNIFQKLIHDADSLDIIRARNHFEAQYLDFYQDFAKNDADAKLYMAKLITEARSLIELQGDSHWNVKPDIKKRYEHHRAYQELLLLIKKNKAFYPLFSFLYNNQTPMSEEALRRPILPDYSSYNALTKPETKEITTELLTAAMYNGQLLVRGLGSPAAVYAKLQRTKDEYSVALEIRKMLRRPGIKTLMEKETKENLHLKKNGNPSRSVSLVSFGAYVYAGQGFLILNPDIEDIEDVSPEDCDSGRGKKNHGFVKRPLMLKEQRQAAVQALHELQKIGGNSKRIQDEQLLRHNEISYRITRVDAIYFCQDPTPHNYNIYGNEEPCNPHTHYLQALFLQQEYKKATRVLLPIFEYSGLHHYIKPAPNYTEDELIAMWTAMAMDVVQEHLDRKGKCSLSLEELKIVAVEGLLYKEKDQDELLKKQYPIDKHYPLALQQKINVAIQEAANQQRVKNEQEYLRKVRGGEFPLLSDAYENAGVFKNLMHSPFLRKELGQPIQEQCEIFFKSFDKELEEYHFWVDRKSMGWGFEFYGLEKAYVLAKMQTPSLYLSMQEKIDAFFSQKIREFLITISEKSLLYFGWLLSDCQRLLLGVIRLDRFDRFKEDIKGCLIQAIRCVQYEEDNIGLFQSLLRCIGDNGFLEGEVKIECDKAIQGFSALVNVPNSIPNFYKRRDFLKHLSEIKDYIAPKTSGFQVVKEAYQSFMNVQNLDGSAALEIKQEAKEEEAAENALPKKAKITRFHFHGADPNSLRVQQNNPAALVVKLQT